MWYFMNNGYLKYMKGRPKLAEKCHSYPIAVKEQGSEA